ncbi:EAL domain-containing protein [Jiella sp. MQZ9-1]|uniref:EAL domain-containing protein n=1 Tax=Jiella flava TaxID=2816857 RepID=A0A939FVN8_9HYPH|nr:EAL domain-containing protein [Jiella flava]MBO0661106.1 EAL domain-containing protein [Jiella flava]MCD2469753.1 EAL domain-containing protein [Jiella flava]
MIVTLAQLAADHSLGVVATALAICLVAGWLSATLLQLAVLATGRPRRSLLAGAVVVAGIGVWTTHFVAMLGYRPDLMLSFGGWTTAVSALVGIMLAGLPFALSAVLANRVARVVMGALSGLGIAGMHFTGMAGLLIGVPVSSPESVMLACLVGAGTLALVGALPVGKGPIWLITGLAFTIAVAGTHFVAIAGTEFVGLRSRLVLPQENTMLSIFTAAGTTVLFLGAFFGVVTSRRFQAQARSHAEILAAALDNMSNGLVYFGEDGSLQLFNRRYLEITGLQPGILSQGMSHSEVIAAIGDAQGWSQDRRKLAIERARLWTSAADSESIEYVMDDGRIMEVELRRVDGGGYVLTFDDVSAQREAQRRIAELAYGDPLTGLPNRRALLQRLEDDFKPNNHFKLLLLDLDRFKIINDTYGHGVGDQLLIEVAGRLSQIAGEAGFVARLGGDEMAVLVYGDLEAATAIAEEILDQISQPFQIGGNEISVGCSIGLCSTREAKDAAELMRFCDIALYESKRRGGDRLSRYCLGMVEKIAARAQLEVDLRVAIARGEFHLVYQPVHSLKHDDRLIGYEALLRWQHPVLGPISPAQFIPLAEETGQIVEIGAWVLEEACRQAAKLPAELYMAVNISAVQFHSPRLLSHLTRALAESNVAPHRLEVELTETAIAEDGKHIAMVLNAMRALGVSIAMDDFGTGYSSLAHLRDMPLDRIKIDRSFVATAETDKPSMAILRGLMMIARELNISILAEGIESASQLELLRRIGCDAGQGYFLGRPGPIAAADKETCLAATA